MFKFIFSLAMFQQLDPQIYELQKEVELYKILIMVSVLVIVILMLTVVLLRISLGRARRAGAGAALPVRSRNNKPAGRGAIEPKNLPDPGLIFKYSFAEDNAAEKHITIGQTAGSIKTFSTEIINDHLNISIRTMEISGEKDIYSVSGSVYEEYMIDLSPAGKTMICYPGFDAFRQLDSVERIFVMKGNDPAGNPSFPLIDPKQPIRIRLGETLDQDEKFVNGYFEFHLFNQEFHTMTNVGIEKFKKNFMLRLYRIYPGYDVSSPDKNGLYPMIDPYGSAGK